MINVIICIWLHGFMCACIMQALMDASMFFFWENYQKMLNKIINYILTLIKTRNYKLMMSSFKNQRTIQIK
jgi:hypothetical protein